MAAQLEQCPTDGSGTTPNQYLTCATTAWTEHDLSFCVRSFIMNFVKLAEVLVCAMSFDEKVCEDAR